MKIFVSSEMQYDFGQLRNENNKNCFM